MKKFKYKYLKDRVSFTGVFIVRCKNLSLITSSFIFLNNIIFLPYQNKLIQHDKT